MKTIQEQINKIKCFLLDLDGTIYLDNVLFPGVLEVLKKMKEKRRIIFLTNNSSKSSSVYLDKLTQLGIKVSEDEIYTSGQASAEYILRTYPNKSVYLLGTKALKEEFINKNIELNETNPDLLLLAYDTELTYKKLCTFTNFLHEDKPYIATHPDINCPSTPYFVPDIGSFMNMIESSTNRSPDIVIGKPFTIMGENIQKKYQLKEDEIAMIGDRLYTDIAFGNRCNFLSILVLSGETSLSDYNKSETKADIVLTSIADLLPYLN